MSLRVIFTILLTMLFIPSLAHAENTMVRSLHSPGTVIYKTSKPTSLSSQTGILSSVQWGSIISRKTGGWLHVRSNRTGWVRSNAVEFRHIPSTTCSPSHSYGTPGNGSQKGAFLFPSENPDWFAWDWRTQMRGGSDFARWGNCAVIHKVMKAIREYRKNNPDSPPVTLGDISKRFGGQIYGHATHQNGTVMDLYYPRKDKQLEEAQTVSQVDTRLSRSFLRSLLRSGAKQVLIGPTVNIPAGGKVVRAPNHDDHFHVIY